MERPSIILIMSDQLKATASHLYGGPCCRPPNLERPAPEGVLFEHAFTPHPLCGPARISLWTAQYPHTHGGRRNQTPMPKEAAHAFKTWKELGYVNALIGKNHCFAEPEDMALFDVWCESSHRGPMLDEPRGMSWVADHLRTAQAYNDTIADMHQAPRFSYAITDHPETCYNTGLLTAQALQFLEDFGKTPFVLWLSYPDPHEPYIAPRHYVDMIPEDLELPPKREGEFAGPEVPERLRVLHEMLGMDDDPEEDIRNLLRVYHANLKFVDDAVGYGFKALCKSLNLREAEGRPKMVQTKKWKYVHDPMDGKDELYDLEQDPYELQNVIGETGNRAIVHEMKTLLLDWSIETEDATPVPLP